MLLVFSQIHIVKRVLFSFFPHSRVMCWLFQEVFLYVLDFILGIVRDERRCYPFKYQLSPINTTEEFMSDYLKCVLSGTAQSLWRVSIQQPMDEGPSFIREFWFSLDPLLENGVEELGTVVLIHVLVGWMSGQHLIQHDTETPPVYCFVMAATSSCWEKLRSYIFVCPTESVRLLQSFDPTFSYPKVCELDVAIFIKDDVFRFQITIENAFLMQIVECYDYLRSIELGLFFRELLLLLQMVKQTSATQVLHHKVVSFHGLKSPEDSHYEWVPECLR